MTYYSVLEVTPTNQEWVQDYSRVAHQSGCFGLYERPRLRPSSEGSNRRL